MPRKIFSVAKEMLSEHFEVDEFEKNDQISKEKLIEVYGANVFIAKTAKEYGYIDEVNSSYDAALTALVKTAGIEENTKYQVLQIEPHQSIFRELACVYSLVVQNCASIPCRPSIYEYLALQPYFRAFWGA